MTNDQYYKDVFHKAALKSRQDGNSNTVYTVAMILALKEMARNDVWPDGTFGDDDCNIWSMLRDPY